MGGETRKGFDCFALTDLASGTVDLYLFGENIRKHCGTKMLCRLPTWKANFFALILFFVLFSFLLLSVPVWALYEDPFSTWPQRERERERNMLSLTFLSACSRELILVCVTVILQMTLPCPVVTSKLHLALRFYFLALHCSKRKSKSHLPKERWLPPFLAVSFLHPTVGKS